MSEAGNLLLGSGEYYGITGLFTRKIREVSAIAEDDAVVYSLSRTYLIKMVVKIPQLANNLLHVYDMHLVDAENNRAKCNS